MAFLEELNPLTPTGDPTQLAQLALEAVRASTRVSTLDEAEVAALTDQAFRIRPELAGLSEQARGLDSTFGAFVTVCSMSASMSPSGAIFLTDSMNWVGGS